LRSENLRAFAYSPGALLGEIEPWRRIVLEFWSAAEETLGAFPGKKSYLTHSVRLRC
jgi:hypothetical protein